jgi:hypothetical protein
MKLKSAHLEDLLRHRDVDTQLVTLQIVYKMLKLLTPEQSQMTLKLLVGIFDQHQNEQCRISFLFI